MFQIEDYRQFIEDFIRNGIKQQVLWSKATATVCQDVLTTYKREKGGNLDFAGTGVSVKACRGVEHRPTRK